VDEVLVVNDGSQDKTTQEASNAGARVLEQPYNQGYIPAIKRGFQEAAGDVVVTIDAEGKFPPDKLPELISLLSTVRLVWFRESGKSYRTLQNGG